MEKKRITWLDIARAIAIISISSNHAVNRAFRDEGSVYEQFMQHSGAVAFIHSVIFIFSRIGVPIFLMITGVLILNKSFENKDDLKKFYRHNLLSILVTSEIWLFLGFWYRTLFHANDFLERGIGYTLGRFAGTMLFFNQETMGNMWYIPMILCFYLLLPFIAVAFRKINPDWFWLPVGLVVAEAMVVPTINRILLINGVKGQLEFGLGSMNLFSRYLTFIIIGYFLNKGLLKKLPLIAVDIIAFVTFMVSAAYQYWEYTLPDGEKVAYNFFPLAFCSVFIFEAIRRHFMEAREHKHITWLSRASFGIYFLHIFITAALSGMSFFNRFHPLVLFVILEAASVGVSIIIILIGSKIPFVKRVVFGIK